MFNNKDEIKRKIPIIRASFEELRDIEHKNITLTGDMVAVIQNCITLTIKHKGLDGMVDDTNAQSVMDVMKLMSKLAKDTLDKAGMDVPKKGYVRGSDLMKGDR